VQNPSKWRVSLTAGLMVVSRVARGDDTEALAKAAQRVLLLSVIMLCGCEGLAIRDTASLLDPEIQRSEVVGIVAGFGTTFAALPDLVAMFRRRSSKGMNPTMAGIMGVFQIAWIYYGLLIASRPVIVWNMIAVVINFLSVGAYLRFAGKERKQAMVGPAA
jgi:MtN3 and saliva related transmembrane protein